MGDRRRVEEGNWRGKRSISRLWVCILNEMFSLPGLERMSNVHPGFELASRMVRIALLISAVPVRLPDSTHSAVRHGTVDFSTTILLEVDTSAIRRVANWR